MLRKSALQVYRVVYDPTTPCWLIQQNGRPALTHSSSKAVAVELALKLGRSADAAQVIIHRSDGSVETEHMFSEGIA